MAGFLLHWCLHSVLRCSLSGRYSIRDGMGHLGLDSISLLSSALSPGVVSVMISIYCERSLSDDR